MRPPSLPSSAFFHPLDAVLGSVGAVRVVRLLATTSSAFSPIEVAERTGLDRSGVRTILNRLVLTGAVEAIGAGRRPLFALNHTHPIAPALERLFEAERQRADTVFDVLRQAIATARPAPVAAWLVGSVARGSDTPASDVDIVVVREEHPAPGESDALADAIAQASALGSTPVVIRLSLADVVRLRATRDPRWEAWSRDAVVLHGPGPGQLRTDGAA
jgi:predicted nucleotidyltransferase